MATAPVHNSVLPAPGETDMLPPPATDTHQPGVEAQPAKRQETAGELAFDRIVYTGIGFGVNEASSLWITDQFMHGKNLFAKVPGLHKAGEWFSATGFERASEWIAKSFKLSEKIASDGSKILPKARGGNTLLMATLLSGGTLLILPMKWLENNKIGWIEKANHAIDGMRGNKLSPNEVAARDHEVEQAIACSPKQSWPSMLLGRVIACTASWGSGTFIVGPERNKQIMEGSDRLLTGAAKAVNLHKLANNDTFHRYAKLTGVETYSCAISSIVLELTSKLFARCGTQIHDPEICQLTAEPPASGEGGSNRTFAAKQARSTPKASVPAAYCEKIKYQKEQAENQPQMAVS